MRRLWLLVLWIAVGWGAACASAPIKKSDQASLVVAQTRVLEGCYQCLLEAREVFERIAVGKARPLLVVRLFEVQVLIGLREREMALDSSEAFGKARALVGELPSTYPAAQYLDLAELMPPDYSGTPRTALRTFRQRVPTKPQLADLKTGLKTGEGSEPFRQYLSASVDCLAELANRADPDVLSQPVPNDAPPLVKYRLATCPVVRAGPLGALLADVPSLVEAGFFLARLPSLNITAAYVKNVRGWLTAASEVFPRSPSITYRLGALGQTVGDCTTAIRYYEDTIALQERHEDAALQRVICLGYLGRHASAIEGATRVIDRSYDNMADAFYWRAWNHHRQGSLALARSDIDRARSMSWNAQVLTLGGVIKYDQDDLALAQTDLTEAIGIDPAQCLAHWYLGLVEFKREAWPTAAEKFGRSASCYESSADENTKKLAEMRAADVDPEFKATQVAGFEAVIKEDRDQQWASVLNTANAFARSNQIPTALEWIDRIPADAVMASKAAELRKLLTGKIQ